MFNSNLVSLNISDDKDTEQVLNVLKKNYNAFYRAYVVDNNDIMNLGRVKVRIPAFHGFNSKNSNYVDTSALPWASPGIFNSAGNDSGAYLIPYVGDTVFVTFEYDNPTLPIYFGGIPSKKGNKSKSIGSTDIFSNKKFVYNSDDLIKDVVHGTERVIYKSLKGATIIVDDYDGEEYVKVIDQSGQTITMQNFGSSLYRRGNLLGISPKAKIEITNNQGDIISLKNNEIFIQSDSLKLNTNSIDIPGKTRDYSIEANLADIINGEEVVKFDKENRISYKEYNQVVDDIIGNKSKNAYYRNIIVNAYILVNNINGEEIYSQNTSVTCNRRLFDTLVNQVIKINGENVFTETQKIKYILNIYLDNKYDNSITQECLFNSYLIKSDLPEVEGYVFDKTVVNLPYLINTNYQVINVYYIKEV